MPTLMINGQSVTVGDDFASAPLAQQNAAAEEIAKNLSAQPQPHRWSVLPLTTDQRGTRFDLGSGITGAIGDAIAAPGDVYTGKLPLTSATGGYNPQMINRAAGFAAAMTPIEGAGVPVPSAQALRGAAQTGYDTFRNSGVEYATPAVSDLAKSIQQNLVADGIIADHAPKTFASLNKIVGDASPGTLATASNMQSLRRSLGGITGDPTDQLAAGRARTAIDGFLSDPPPGAVAAAPGMAPEQAAQSFKDANANYAAAQRSNDLAGGLDRANTGIFEQAEARAHASHSGTNIDNSIRQRVASFLQNPNNVAGFSTPEIDALQNLVRGGAVQNAARRVGNLFGGGGGWGQLAAGFGGAMLGQHTLGPEGAALGAMFPTATGMSAKALENSLARSRLGGADEMIRMNSPLYRMMQSQPQMLPSLDSWYGLGKGMLPGMLAPPPQALGGGWI